MKEATLFSIRIYHLIARLFPEEFRALHARPLLDTSEDLIRDVAARYGGTGLVPVMCRILFDLVLRVIAEHVRDFKHDTRHAVRVLRGSPGFTAAAVLSIALGLGVAIGIFSQMNSTVLAPLGGVEDPDSLVTTGGVSFPAFEAFQEDGPFLDVAAYTSAPLTWKNDDGGSRRVWAHAVSSNYFSLLGAQVQSGRLFSQGDPAAVVLNERFWQEHFGGDHGAFGTRLSLNGRPMTIVGVAGRGFDGTEPFTAPADLWMPAQSDTPFVPRTSTEILADREDRRFSIIGRLGPGVPVASAEAALDTIARRFVPAQRLTDPAFRGRQISLLNGGRQIPMSDEELPVILGVVIVMVALMLGIAAANVGTLLLARAAARRREVAIRLGLGASRMRILRQFLTESLVLALVAGVAGYGIGWAYKTVIDFAYRTVGESYGMALGSLPMGAGMLGLSLALSLGCGLMFGIAPALHAVRSSVADAMKPGPAVRMGGFRWWSARNLLMLQQVAGSLALLLLTGFVVLGVVRTSDSDLAFNDDNLYMVAVDPIRDGYAGDRAAAFLENLPERVARLAGIRSAALSYDAPVGLRSAEAQSLMKTSTELESIARLGMIQTRAIGRGFVETLDLPLLAGASFRPSGEENATVPPVLVNETLARGSWPGATAVGQTLDIGGKTHEIAGVVADIELSGLFARTPPTAYRLLTDADRTTPSAFGYTLIVRSFGGDPIPSIRQLLASTDPDVEFFNPTTIRRERETATRLGQLNMMVYGGIGLFGLVLAAVGISGITAYAVVQRRKEIGIRLALGASRGHILGLVAREGTVLVALGMLIGLGLAVAGARLLGAWFTGLAQATGTTTTDPVLLIGAPLLLGVLTMVAAWVPARRSLRINPAATLKEQ